MPPTDHISEKFRGYWGSHTLLDKAEKELEQLLNNPITYNGETDITFLWQVNLYRDRLAAKRREMDARADAIVKLNDELITILQSFSIPAGTRMTLHISDATTLAFWYDEDRYLHWEVMAKPKKQAGK